MIETSDSSLPAQESRHCPVCGIQVAVKASECLMCGASLVEEAEKEHVDEKKRAVPGWVGSVAVVLLSVLILGAGGFGLYTMLAVEPEPEPTVVVITPSPTPTPEPSSTPTDTPLPPPTPTPVPPRSHDVQEGETVSDIADLYDVTVDDILALNPDVEPELIRPGQVLLVPASASAPADVLEASGGADQTSASSGFVVHVVRAGETLSAIAEEYDVSVSIIRAANNLAEDDETIRPDQSLVIPRNTPTPTSTPTVDPNATATPAPLYASPTLLHPPDGAVLTDGTPVLLQWSSVGVLEDHEWYELYLWQPAGGVISDTVRTRATAWRVPLDVLHQAEGQAPRFYWRVRVVREAAERVYEEAGSPSPPHLFEWQAPTSTQPPETPTP